MKKITFTVLLICAFILNMNAQILNQNASWPNGSWSLTGAFTPTSLLSDPTTTSNFSYDDDASGFGTEDNIAAESPVIDLTAASGGGETWLRITVDLVYRYLSNDELKFQWWDADGGTWVDWGPPNTTTTTGAPFGGPYCGSTFETWTSEVLNISGFTGTQLSGFRYRISYDDDPAGADWNYGFCFQSPTISSETPPACPDPTAPAISSITNNSAQFDWTPGGSETSWDVELVDITGGGTATGTPTQAGVSNPYTFMSLASGNDYEAYVRADCGGSGTSNWVGPVAFTTLFDPPANDECANAVTLTVNSDFSCAVTTAGTTAGATASPQADDVTGTPDNDVWFSFVATGSDHQVSLLNVTAVVGTSTDMGMGVYDGTGGCAGLVFFDDSDPNSLNLTGLTGGTTYYVRVYGWSAGPGAQADFDICVGTPPSAPANDECANAVALTVNPDFNCGTTTAGTTVSATASPQADDVTGTPDNDVWFSFVATGTDHQVSLLNVTAVVGTSTDMGMGVYDGTGGCAGLVFFDDSDPNTLNLTGLTGGTTYYVRVYGWGSGPGAQADFDICVGTPPPPPANDDCANAVMLTAGTTFSDNPVDGTVASATSDAVTNGCGSNGPGVWYSVVVPPDGNITIETFEDSNSTPGFDSVIEAFSGSCGALTSIDCDDDGAATGNYSLLNLSGQVPGSTIYIRVWEFGGNENEPFSISAYSATLSLEDEAFSSFKYYPNPVDNRLTLDARSNIQNVVFYNMLGQEVMKLSPNMTNTSIDTSTLQAGTYFVQVYVNDRLKTIKIIKE